WPAAGRRGTGGHAGLPLGATEVQLPGHRPTGLGERAHRVHRPTDRSGGPVALPGLVPRPLRVPRAMRRADLRRPVGTLRSAAPVGGGALHASRRPRHQSMARHAGERPARGGARPAPIRLPFILYADRAAGFTPAVCPCDGPTGPQENAMANTPKDPSELSLKPGSGGRRKPDFGNVKGSSDTKPGNSP